MNIATFCLSLMPLLSPGQRPPPPVLEMVQSHVLRELKKENPHLVVNFDLASCPHVAHYEEGLSSLKITGETATWSGEKEISYTDALAERPMDFSAQLNPSRQASLLYAKAPSKEKRKIWKYVLWGGVGLAASALLYRSLQNTGQKNDASTELKVGVTF